MSSPFDKVDLYTELSAIRHVASKANAHAGSAFEAIYILANRLDYLYRAAGRGSVTIIPNEAGYAIETPEFEVVGKGPTPWQALDDAMAREDAK